MKHVDKTLCPISAFDCSLGIRSNVSTTAATAEVDAIITASKLGPYRTGKGPDGSAGFGGPPAEANKGAETGTNSLRGAISQGAVGPTTR